MIWWEVERFTKILKELGRIRNSDVFSDTCSVSNFLWSLMKVGRGLQGRRGQADAVGRNAWKSGHVRGVEKHKLRKVKSNYIELTNGLIMNSNDILRIVKNEHVGRLPRFHRISHAFHGSQSWFEWRNDLKRLCGHQKGEEHSYDEAFTSHKRERERGRERERCASWPFSFLQILFNRIDMFVQRFHAYLTCQVGGRTFVVRSYVYWIAGKMWRKSGKISVRSCRHSLAFAEHFLDRWVYRSAMQWSCDRESSDL